MSWFCPACLTRFGSKVERCPNDSWPTVEDHTGLHLGGKYVLERLIGVGGMGSTVWQAKQHRIDRPVAVKLLPQLSEIPTLRFEREARIASNLRHPNIVVIYDYGNTEDQKLYLVMELLEGVTLEQVLRASQRISIPRALHICTQVLRALGHAHSRRVVHRDLKPSNLFLTQANEDQDFVKVLDFGLAKYFADDDSDTLRDCELDVTGQRQVVCGTPSYMAPEQWRGRIDARTDIYALGVILFRMATGKLPFTGHPDYELYHRIITQGVPALAKTCPGVDFPGELERIIRKALARDPDRRYESARDMRKDIEGLAARCVSGESAPIELSSSELQPATPGAIGPDDPEAVVLLSARPGSTGSRPRQKDSTVPEGGQHEAKDQPSVIRTEAARLMTDGRPPSSSIVVPQTRWGAFVAGSLLAGAVILAVVLLGPLLLRGSGTEDGQRDRAKGTATDPEERQVAGVEDRRTGEREAPEQGRMEETPEPEAESEAQVGKDLSARSEGSATARSPAGPRAMPKQPIEQVRAAAGEEPVRAIPGTAAVHLVVRPAGALVLEGGRVVGTAPATLDLAPGEHVLTFEAREHYSTTAKVAVTGNDVGKGLTRHVVLRRRARQPAVVKEPEPAPQEPVAKPEGPAAGPEAAKKPSVTLLGSPDDPAAPAADKKRSGKAHVDLLEEDELQPVRVNGRGADEPRRKPSTAVRIDILDEQGRASAPVPLPEPRKPSGKVKVDVLDD